MRYKFAVDEDTLLVVLGYGPGIFFMTVRLCKLLRVVGCGIGRLCVLGES